MADFNWLDYLILAIFAISILLGLVRGLVSEIISIVALVAAFFIAVNFSDALALQIMNYSSVQNLAVKTSGLFGGNTSDAISYIILAISFLLLFTGTILIGIIVKLILNLVFQTGLLGIGNRILGGIFGLGRGYILNLVLIFILQLTSLSEQEWWRNSYFVGFFQPAVVWLNTEITPVVIELKDKLQNSGVMDKVQNLIQRPSNAK